jgi:hypothetical protein
VEVRRDAPETKKPGGTWRKRNGTLLLLCVIGFAAALAVAGYLLRSDDVPTAGQTAGSRASARPVQPHGSTAECWQPLTAYCKDRLCPDFAATIARIKCSTVPSRTSAYVGTCGEYRYIDWGNSVHSVWAYFDATGRLVATHVATDEFSLNVECPNWTHYGPRIECAPQIARDHCQPGS